MIKLDFRLIKNVERAFYTVTNQSHLEFMALQFLHGWSQLYKS